VLRNPALTGPVVIKLFPADNLPNPADPVYVGDYVVDPNYTTAPSGLGHDLAFIHTPNPRWLSNYLTPFGINERVDSINTILYAYYGDSNYDPFAWHLFAYFVDFRAYATANFSWNWSPDQYRYLCPNCFGHYLVQYNSGQIIQVGYPGAVNGVTNAANLPYKDGGSAWLGGNALQAGTSRPFVGSSLYYPCSGCAATVGVYDGAASGGDSGGPIIGYQTSYNYVGGSVFTSDNWSLLGVMTSSLSPVTFWNGATHSANVGSGFFGYNASFFSTNKNWTPGAPAPVITTSPNPIPIPAGATSAKFTLSVNAPNYSTVTLYGKNNLYGNTIYCLGTVPGSWTSTQNAYPGEYGQAFITPNTGCTAGSTVPAVPNPVLASTAFSTQQVP
jgi:hypothetical protein